MSTFLSVSEVARRLRVRPRDISDLFYTRRLSDDLCPIIGGRRMIPADYLPFIEAVVQEARTSPDAGLRGCP